MLRVALLHVAAACAATGPVPGSARRVNVEVEVLLFELPERAVLVDLRQRLVEHRLQIGVALAQADGRAVADRLRVLHFLAGQAEALAARRLQEAGVGLNFVLQRGVEAARARSAYT